jgi:hypothetical protein
MIPGGIVQAAFGTKLVFCQAGAGMLAAMPAHGRVLQGGKALRADPR